MKSHIGIILATYNGAKYVKEQLNSIINQSVKPDLIVISDGGSQDQTVCICENTLEKSGISYIILTSNCQLSVKDNFEKGLMNCCTDYIFFSDQDDLWLPNKIEDFMEVFYGEQADLIFCNAYITDSVLNKKRKNLWESIGYKPDSEKKIYENGDLKFLNELFKHNVVTGMCMAINSRIVNKILPLSEYAIHDVWIAHLTNIFGKIVAINRCEVLYRQHDNNVIGAKFNPRNSFNNRNKYYRRIKRRIYFMKEIKYRCADETFVKRYDKYISYLQSRIEFLERKIPIFSIVKYIGNYRLYEKKWCQILAKDWFVRLMLRKRLME